MPQLCFVCFFIFNPNKQHLGPGSSQQLRSAFLKEERRMSVRRRASVKCKKRSPAAAKDPPPPPTGGEEEVPRHSPAATATAAPKKLPRNVIRCRVGMLDGTSFAVQLPVREKNR